MSANAYYNTKRGILQGCLQKVHNFKGGFKERKEKISRIIAKRRNIQEKTGQDRTERAEKADVEILQAFWGVWKTFGCLYLSGMV